MVIDTGDTVVEDNVAEQLDQEIESLQSQIRKLKSIRAIHTTNILSSRSSQAILSRLRASAVSRSNRQPLSTAPDDSNPLHQEVLSRSRQQIAHNQECLYRTCSGVTTFKVQDPDPCAVDGGAVVGIRIEVFTGGKFIRPYYVFLNKPYPGAQIMRVHRHTVPPAIPLAALAARHLPTPAPGDTDFVKVKRQNLSKFIRSLRKEIAAYHNRVSGIAGIRKAFALDPKKGRDKGKGREQLLRDVSAADAEARQIRFEWVDGKIGRVIINSGGDILKCVIIGEEGRDKSTERKILGGNGRLEGVAERLGASV